MRYPFDKFALGTRYGVTGKYWACGYHSGQDFKSANYGGDGKIHPLYKGVVQKVTTTGSYGNCVYVKHPDGYITLYAHMKKVYVHAGQAVNEHTALGIEGATGNATGVHCHVEVHKGSYHYPASIDPLTFIRDRLEEEEVTQEEFNKMMKNYLDSLDKGKPQDWSKDARTWAEKNGLIEGKADGMAYESWVTREQMVVFLQRLATILKKEK